MADTLRPTNWDEYIGQEQLKRRLKVSISGALQGNRSLGHTLLFGPPGVGKTSLAALIAKEMWEDFEAKVCPVPPKVIRTHLMEQGGILFLDEIHRLKKGDQEDLLSILEDHQIQFANGTKVDIPTQFTIIGATTELKAVIEPLRDRFHHQPRFEPYTEIEMAQIFQMMCSRLGVDVSKEDAHALGRASAGVPRQAKRLALASRDLGTTHPPTVLEFAQITPEGFTEDHLRYMEALNSLSGVAGIDILANYLNLPKDVLVDLEKLLIDRKTIEYTPKGRSLLVKGLGVLDKYDRA